MEQVLPHVIDYGVVGILFVMWYLERQDRIKSDKNVDKLLELGERANKNSEILIGLAQRMTEAVDKLSKVVSRIEKQ